jgi:hypothetical protein
VSVAAGKLSNNKMLNHFRGFRIINLGEKEEEDFVELYICWKTESSYETVR